VGVRIIENWTDIVGSVRLVESSPRLKDFDVMQVEIEKMTKVPGYPSLLNDREDAISVHIPSSLVSELGIKEGVRLSFRARKAGKDSIFVQQRIVSVLDKT
jgi:hypothetical protein